MITAELSIAIVEPFYGGSHKYWVDQLEKRLSFKTKSYTLPGRHWKWRMSAGALYLAKEVNESNLEYDLFLVSDMLDVPLFKSLLVDKYREAKIVIYMHENQVVYPFQTLDKNKNWDRHYGLINFKSMLCADEVWFNSSFHRDVLLSEMETFLHPFPESKYLISLLKRISSRSHILPIGYDRKELEMHKSDKAEVPTILWNHRWEYDKNPEAFFEALFKLSEDEVSFDLIVCGETYSKQPEIFKIARSKLANQIKHWGYFDTRTDYVKALWQSTILPVTSNQEFFGLSVLEAIFCQVTPIMPNRLSYSSIYGNRFDYYSSDDEFYEILKQTVVSPQSRDNSVDDLCWSAVIQLYEQRLLKVGR